MLFSILIFLIFSISIFADNQLKDSSKLQNTSCTHVCVCNSDKSKVASKDENSNYNPIKNRPIDYLVIIVLGALLGATGQGIRIITGLKKLYDQASSTNQTMKDLYKHKQLIHSLIISLVIGAIAGVLSAIIKEDNFTVFTNTNALTLIASGYAGTDFIEGFMKSSLQSSKR